jgi:hypothetical protein
MPICATGSKDPYAAYSPAGSALGLTSAEERMPSVGGGNASELTATMQTGSCDSRCGDGAFCANVEGHAEGTW